MPTDKPLSYSQRVLLDQINAYLKIRGEGSLAFQSSSGICAGLDAYWLYSMRIGDTGKDNNKFIDQLEYAISWDAEKFKRSNLKLDFILEELLNTVLFLFHDKQLRNVERHRMDQSINLLLGPEHPKVAAPEFTISFVFDKAYLEKLITNFVYENKMINFGNGLHMVGLIYREGAYHFYDPNSTAGPKVINNAHDLANDIFNGLAAFCNSKKHIALNITAFDLEGATAASYPLAADYCRELLNNAHYARAVLKHQNILRVGLVHDDYAMLDMLFAYGYKYVHKGVGNCSELGEAVLEKDVKRISYLLNHDVPIDYKSKNSMTALAYAIEKPERKEETRNDILYYLIQRGANPNCKVNVRYTPLEWAAEWRNRDAIIILLASGAKCEAKFLQLLEKKFSRTIIREIKEQAVKLNSELLEIDHDSDFAVVMAHSKLKMQLGLESNVFSGYSKNIAKFHVIDNLVAIIINQDPRLFTKDHLIEIAGALNRLYHLSSVNSISSPSNIVLAYKASRAAHKIEQHLEKVHVNASERIIFSNLHLNNKRFEKNVVPFLQEGNAKNYAKLHNLV